MLHVRTHREEWGEDRAEEEPGPAGGAAQAHTHIQYGAPVLHVHTQRNTAQNMQSAVMPKSAYSTLWSFDTHKRTHEHLSLPCFPLHWVPRNADLLLADPKKN